MALKVNDTPSKIFFKNKKEEPTGGVLTELYSEVLAQICLAYSIVNGGSQMKWDDIALVDRSGDPYLDAKGRAVLKTSWLTGSMRSLIILPIRPLIRPPIRPPIRLPIILPIMVRSTLP